MVGWWPGRQSGDSAGGVSMSIVNCTGGRQLLDDIKPFTRYSLFALIQGKTCVFYFTIAQNLTLSKIKRLRKITKHRFELPETISKMILIWNMQFCVGAKCKNVVDFLTKRRPLDYICGPIWPVELKTMRSNVRRTRCVDGDCALRRPHKAGVGSWKEGLLLGMLFFKKGRIWG